MKLKLYLPIILLGTFLLAFFHWNHFGKDPLTFHAWAQFDQLAIVQSFQEDGHPIWETNSLVYNKQYPSWTTLFNSTRTSSDLAIHSFLVAKFSNWFACSPVSAFHAYILFWTLIAWIAVFQIGYRWSKNYSLSLVGLFILSASPVFVFYQTSTLINIPSWSWMVLGVVFYQRFLSENQTRYFYFSLFWLTLAALSRTTFLIPLVSVLLVSVFFIRKKPKLLSFRLVSTNLLALIFVFAYLIWSGKIRTEFGSLFLGNLMPAKDLADFVFVLQFIWNHWFLDYFAWPVWSILIIALLFLIGKTTRHIKHLFSNPWYVWISLFVAGNILFFLVMSKQYINHDYYFIDSGLLPIWLLGFSGIVLIYKRIKNNLYQKIFVGGLLSMGILSIPLVFNELKSRHTVDESAEFVQCFRNFETSKKWLDQQKIPKNAKMLVFDAMIPNMAFYQMHRKGYTLLNEDEKSIQTLFSWPWDYALIQPEIYAKKIQTNYPNLIFELEKVSSNGYLILCKKRKVPQKTSWQNWLYDSIQKPFLHAYWDQGKSMSSHKLKSPIEVKSSFSAKDDYPAVISFPITSSLKSRKISYQTTLKMRSKPDSNIHVCVAIFDANGSVLYTENWTQIGGQNEGKSARRPISFTDFNQATELRFYLWNHQKIEGKVDHFSVEVY